MNNREIVNWKPDTKFDEFLTLLYFVIHKFVEFTLLKR